MNCSSEIKLIRKIGNYSNVEFKADVEGYIQKPLKPVDKLPLTKGQSSISSLFQREFPYRHSYTCVAGIITIIIDT